MEDSLRGKKVVIAGLGVTAVSLARLLLTAGARPFVSEQGPARGREALVAKLKAFGVPYELGAHSPGMFDAADLCVPSPGVSPDIPPLASARARGVPVVGEMALAARFCQGRILAVTGTNGKTTTTELLHAMVTACGHTALLAGNNKTPLSEAALADPPPDYVVLEVSSYQLETADQFAPWIGAVLNLTPDHLGRHGTMDEYARVKGRLFAGIPTGGAAVVNADDPRTAAMPVPAGVRRLLFSTREHVADGLWCDGGSIRAGEAEVARVDDVPLPGAHNLANALAALTMARAAGFNWEAVRNALRGFAGVEHRIEWVTALHGVSFYNDSKSTNVDSLKVALESFDAPIVLIAGGQGKGAGYTLLRPLVETRVKALVSMGEDAPCLEADLHGAAPIVHVNDMSDAVAQAYALAEPGDVVLLSPGCASFDRYANFEARGCDFKEHVAALVREKGERQQ
ncbi:MAG: UDP-N-acetylmuramoyl-L-alanine--D-glutamate ligase [Candidatus Hydrogenedentota bacterium]